METANRLYEALSGAQASEVDAEEPGNWLRHAASLSLTKSADGLFDPKLVLSWLLTALAVPSVYVGLLVPIREAGALLPQLFTAPHIHAMARRKWAWAGAAAVQGAMLVVILLVALTMEGAAPGLAICAALAVLALARSVASVSYKDVLGKTVGQARRGAATGFAASAGAAVVIIFALILMVAPVERMTIVLGALTLAALAFLGAAVIFAGLREAATPEEADTAWRAALGQMRLLWREPGLGRFVIARGLLVATALAPPYLVLLAAEAGNRAFERLGALVLASAVASLMSSYVWGRLADRSSRRVLIYAGLAGAAALILALALRAAGLAGTVWALPLALFALMIAYHGVRQGRSTYLVDMAPEDKRLPYTAVANTAIGLLLLGAGVFGALASLAGAAVTIALFAAMAAAGAAVAAALPEAEG
ncbi:MFS transporter [Marimonas lutisalis]|uniref:MFS transporter n=1 Tax=Marimonas lutisalis TaxID=2545756 RepID=UPI001F211595|nr:MFS transporter [Marimonas lutisalis]